MPIEIKELIIRATVEDQSPKPQKEKQKPAAAKTQLVEECVEQVLEILRKERER